MAPALGPGEERSASQGLDPGLRWLAAAVVAGAIMALLDTTIVNVAIDTLGRELRTTLPTIQWVSTGYLLALALVIPLTAWAGVRFGVKRMWMLSISLLLPLYYQIVRGRTPLDAGLLLAPAGDRRGDGDADRRTAHRQARGRAHSAARAGARAGGHDRLHAGRGAHLLCAAGGRFGGARRWHTPSPTRSGWPSRSPPSP